MIRKNKKFIDPRYFMEEKTEGYEEEKLITEALLKENLLDQLKAGFSKIAASVQKTLYAMEGHYDWTEDPKGFKKAMAKKVLDDKLAQYRNSNWYWNQPGTPPEELQQRALNTAAQHFAEMSPEKFAQLVTQAVIAAGCNRERQKCEPQSDDIPEMMRYTVEEYEELLKSR